MSVYDDVKATLESPGAAHIRRAFQEAHKGLYRKMRVCTPEELPHLQAAMKAIDSTLPAVIERLMNQHLQQIGNTPPPRQEFFFEQLFKCSPQWVKNIKIPWVCTKKVR